MLNEKELLAALRLRDPAAFNQLFETYSDRIYRLAVGLLGNETEAEGVVQDTFMREFERREERFGIRRAIEFRLIDSNANWVSMPQPTPVRGTRWYGPGPILEGGDVLLVGRDIYAGNSGHASNLAGIQWWQHLLGPEHRVHPVRLNRGYLHLDVV